MTHPGGRPLAFETVEDLQEKVDSYFAEGGPAYVQMGEHRVFAPTMSGLARHLGVDRRTVTNYSNKCEFFPTIKKARARVEEVLEQRLYGQGVAGVIFNLKNNFDWQDKQDLSHTSPDGSMTPKAIDLSGYSIEDLQALANIAGKHSSDTGKS